MPYDKPLVRPFILTDKPLCLPDIISQLAYRWQEGWCVCPCIAPCTCINPCSCPGCQALPTLRRMADAGAKLDEPASILPSAVPKLSPRFRFRKEEVGGLLFDNETWHMLLMNETGSQTLQLVDGRRTAADIAKELAKRHDIVPELVQPDVMQFLGRLASAGAVVI
jgi:hypothetical protein